MKFILLLVVLSLSLPVHAETYKCKGKKGRPVYQAVPCESGGVEVKLKRGLSKKRQQEAVQKLDRELSIIAAKKKKDKKDYDAERKIRAEENKADAEFQSARESARQANALEQRNSIERNKFTVPYNPAFRRYKSN